MVSAAIRLRPSLFRGLLTLGLMVGISEAPAGPVGNSENEIVIQTVLPKDAIPAILDPVFKTAEEAKIGKRAPVAGVSINGESHAYSIHLLNGHEIVNDIVGGKPIAATW